MLVLKLLGLAFAFVVACLKEVAPEWMKSHPKGRISLLVIMVFSFIVSGFVIFVDDVKSAKAAQSKEREYQELQRQFASLEERAEGRAKVLQEKILDLNERLDPFIRIATARFPKARTDVALQKLQELQREVAEAKEMSRSATAALAELQPSFRLLDQRVSPTEDGKWQTVLVFGSPNPAAFEEFGVSIEFDGPYENAEYSVRGAGVVVTGNLQLLEGKFNSKVFRFRGTNLMASNYFVVTLISRERLGIRELEVIPNFQK